ncbi:MAG: 16S rRNA (uracil(1498)-N(3))-methyltransferase [Nitrospirae bacterium]|nr:16S rRNA (uracil(1498)-N(3))-methyltransferase [Nitrospirota bacterium]
MSTFFVDPDAITPPTIRITGDLLHHLRNSLRIHPGDSLTLNDASGTRYSVEVTRVSSQAIDSHIIDQQVEPTGRTSPIVLGQALIKGDKMDWVIQKATELGVATIVPLYSIHGVIKSNPERTDHQRARWNRIARDAAQQSERWTIPTIADPIHVAEICRQYTASPLKSMLMERSSSSSLATISLPQDRSHSIVLLIGPEGGWAANEQRLAQEQGFLQLSLGPRILRAETAAIAALSILQSRLDEMMTRATSETSGAS